MFFSWIAILISIPILWLLQNIIHELSHGLTMKIGWNWDFKIWPFPSKKLGRFTFAHVKYDIHEDSKNPSPKGRALGNIMPKISNAFFILLSGIFLYFGIGPSILLSVLAVFMVCNLVDGIVGTQVIFRDSKKDSGSDLWRFQKNYGIDLTKLRVIAGIILAVAILFTGGAIIPYFFIGG